MQLERQSAVILSFPQAGEGRAFSGSLGKGGSRIEAGRLANILFMGLVLALAALWLVFPPVELSGQPAGSAIVAQNLRAEGGLH